MKTQTWLATTVALLLTGCSSDQNHPTQTATKERQGQCKGANSCKGTGSCATKTNHCAGQNRCQGKGWLPLTQSDCHKKGGRFASFSKED